MKQAYQSFKFRADTLKLIDLIKVEPIRGWLKKTAKEYER